MRVWDEDNNLTIKRNYYRIRLGKGASCAQKALDEGFVGLDYAVTEDLSPYFKKVNHWKEFNKLYVPRFLESHNDWARVGAGQACAALFVLGEILNNEDWVFAPLPSGEYIVGKINGDYHYVHGDKLPHRRSVSWLPKRINFQDASDALKRSLKYVGSLMDFKPHVKELEQYLSLNPLPIIQTTDNTIEDPSVFALEKHLEDFLVKNWEYTELGKKYDIYEEDGELLGQQFQSDTGPIDLLAISKDKSEVLVIELKKGRASDVVIGQVQRYMGYIIDQLAEESQLVKGIIIAHEDDLRIRRALMVTNNIEFYKYELTFDLKKI